MKRYYFWDGKVVNSDRHSEDTREKYTVDTEYKLPDQRYGMYTRHGGWRPIPIEIFPPEFRVHLLLLGVA